MIPTTDWGFLVLLGLAITLAYVFAGLGYMMGKTVGEKRGKALQHEQDDQRIRILRARMQEAVKQIKQVIES